MEPQEPRPPRRKRYSGRNPQRFEEKYKELDPTLDPDTIAKVIASGKTPAGSHVPIMVDECLAALALKPGMVGVDCTLGYGGHALRILPKLTPGGKLLGLDQDPLELPKTEQRLHLAGFGPECFEALRSNFAGISKVLAQRGLDGVDFVLADLGCSSMQFDDPTRGFSFKHDGPLDMRMNPTRSLSAAEWLARTTPIKLARALYEHADEPRAELLASHLAGRKFSTTLELAAAIKATPGLHTEDAELTLRRVFQTLRIAVNEEFTALETFLRVLPECLKPGGRAVILTFHSGEDRRVKKAFQAGLRNGLLTDISRNVTTASPAERHQNPRSSPAKLRWALRA